MLDYNFNDPALFEQALTHRSIGNNNNERLEYLGDAILGFIIADVLYKKYPNLNEGKLTRLRASMVKGEKLAEIARNIELPKHLKLGTGELKSGGWRRDSILANALEAIVGAIYLDGGLENCRKVVLSLYASCLEQLDPEKIEKDPKTRLQEYLQSRQYAIPIYTVIEEGGSPHQPKFTVRCQIDVFNQPVTATAQSKRKAEQAAATTLLSMLNLTE